VTLDEYFLVREITPNALSLPQLLATIYLVIQKQHCVTD